YTLLPSRCRFRSRARHLHDRGPRRAARRARRADGRRRPHARAARASGAAVSRLEAWRLQGLPEVRPGDDLAALIATAAGGELRPGYVLVVAHKIVSKAEGA